MQVTNCSDGRRFDEFKLEFKRSYASAEEEAQRYDLFRQTFEKIQARPRARAREKAPA